MLFQIFHNLSHGRFFLPDSNIDAFNSGVFLSDDGVNANCRLAYLAVADNEFALSAANGRHSVNSLQSCVHWLINGLTFNNSGSNHFNTTVFIGLNRSLAVKRCAGRINYTSQQSFANRHLRDLTGSLYDVAFFDMSNFTQNRNTDIVCFQIENHAQNAAGEFQKFHRHCILYAVYSGNTITNGQNSSGFAYIQLFFIAFYLLRNNLTNFFRFNCFHALSSLP